MRAFNNYIFIVIHRQYAKFGKTAECAANVLVLYIEGFCNIR